MKSAKVMFFILLASLLLTCRGIEEIDVSVSETIAVQIQMIGTSTKTPTEAPPATTTETAPTSTPVAPTSTPKPTETPVPTLTPTTPYEPYQQFLIFNTERESIDLESVIGTTVRLTVLGLKRFAEATFPNGAITDRDLVGDCDVGPKMLVSMLTDKYGNAFHNVITIFGHSGACSTGILFPFEAIRELMEGLATRPDLKKREENLPLIVNNPEKAICFNDVCFEIERAEYFSKEEYTDGIYQAVIDRFDISPDRQYVFIIFCGSDGFLRDQWFAGRYVILLKTTNPR